MVCWWLYNGIPLYHMTHIQLAVFEIHMGCNKQSVENSWALQYTVYSHDDKSHILTHPEAGEGKY